MTQPLPVGLPEKMSVNQTYDSLTITRKWFGLEAVFLIFFAIVWNSLMVMFVSQHGFDINEPSLYWLHLGVGIYVAYRAFAGIFNSTQITTTKQKIDIKHKPLPWIGNKTISAFDIKQLYCKEKVTKGRNGTSVSYVLHALTKDNKDVKLLAGLSSIEQALYLEQQIEKYLSIVDQPVRGQI